MYLKAEVPTGFPLTYIDLMAKMEKILVVITFMTAMDGYSKTRLFPNRNIPLCFRCLGICPLMTS